MKPAVVVFLIAVTALAALGACAAPPRSLTFTNARTSECKTGDSCAVSMLITNSASELDKMFTAATSVARSPELHSTVSDGKGGTATTRVMEITVPANGSLELKPGAFQIVLVGVTKDLKTGDTFPMTLRFQHAGEVTVQVTVGPAN